MSGGNGGPSRDGTAGGSGGTRSKDGGAGTSSSGFGSGGGGGGAGGGAGGAGGDGQAGAGGAGGKGGTSTHRDGYAGGNAPNYTMSYRGYRGSYTGAGGGGGGFDGYDGTGKTLSGAALTGGNGGQGGTSGGYRGGGGGGGAGGYGAVVSARGIENNVVITGGTGGAGGVGGPIGYIGVAGGDGGGGGAGLLATSQFLTLSNSAGASIRGGDGGGGGGNYHLAQLGGAGGRGGSGLATPANNVLEIDVTNAGAISGGIGGNSNYQTAGSIGGGRGGDGAVLNAAVSSVVNTGQGTITGGAGGSAYIKNSYAIGGSGGNGISFTQSGGMVTNDGIVRGGAGGAGGTRSGQYGAGATGAGGAGIWGAGMTIVDTGTITGGGGATQADAITFTGGDNTLALGAQAGKVGLYGLLGALDIVTGRLTFNQTAGTGLPADVELDDTIIGAGAVTKDGSGTLTLTGVSSYSGGTTIAAGTLSISAEGNLGATSGALVLSGGTLETTATLTSTRTLSLNTSGTIQVDTGTTTLAGAVSGKSGLTKTGAGTLVLNQRNTYAGDTTFAAGTVSVGSDVNLGAASGNLVFTGGTLETSGSFVSKRAVTLDNSGTFQVDDGTTSLSQLAGSYGFFKTGAGTLQLSGTNTYQGDSTISAGTLSVGADASLGASSSEIVLAGGTLETTATFTSARAVKLNATGTVQVDTGTTTFSGIVAGPQHLVKTGNGTLKLSGADSYSGGTTLSAGTLDLAGASASGKGAITFAASTGRTVTLVVEAAALPATGGTLPNTLTGFGSSDVLDLTSLAYSAGATATYDAGNSRLVVSSGGVTDYFTLASPTSQTFHTHRDAAGGTLVDTVCFAQGTRIRTSDGDVEVEHLRIGHVAVTAAGHHRPIVWLGHRTLRGALPPAALPIRIAAHAFAPDRPARDLAVSPGHAICVDLLGEVLVPAGCLVNGASIRREVVAEVTYWHVELDAHDILLAENLACESYIDMGNRAFFRGSDIVLDKGIDALAPMPGAARTEPRRRA